MFVGLLATFAGYHTMFVLLALVGMAGIGMLQWQVTVPLQVKQTPSA